MPPSYQDSESVSITVNKAGFKAKSTKRTDSPQWSQRTQSSVVSSYLPFDICFLPFDILLPTKSEAFELQSFILFAT